jgi:hypothetical protein
MINSRVQETDSRHSQRAALSISIPKYVGIKGMGERIAANLVTGGGSLTLRSTTAPGPSGFSAQLLSKE